MQSSTRTGRLGAVPAVLDPRRAAPRPTTSASPRSTFAAAGQHRATAWTPSRPSRSCTGREGCVRP
eukprot:1327454-Rhodomonas_salina.2